MLCQNGWGNAEVFAERLCQSGSLTLGLYGFERQEPSRLSVTVHVQPIRIGSLYHNRTETAEAICGARNRRLAGRAKSRHSGKTCGTRCASTVS